MRTLKIFAIALALSALAVRIDAAPLRGERFPLADPPLWTSSGVWVDQGRSLLLIDVLRDEVRRYDAQGRFEGVLQADPAKARGQENPSIIQAASDGSVWIEYEDGRLYRLNDQFRLERPVDITGAEGPQGKVIALFWWVPLGSSEFLAFANIEAGGAAAGAVLRVPIEAPGNFQVLHKIPLGSPEHRFYQTGQSFLASVQGNPYYMIMDEIPYLVRPDGGRLIPVRQTKAGSQPLERPDLPRRVNMETTRLLFQALETNPGPAGIYGWKDSLYVLMRVSAKRGLAWALLKINPNTNQVVWNRLLDTTASHLVVIPGDRYWAFVEKGPVKGPGNQEVRSVLRIPSDALAD